jgi:hypothetical protein
VSVAKQIADIKKLLNKTSRGLSFDEWGDLAKQIKTLETTPIKDEAAYATVKEFADYSSTFKLSETAPLKLEQIQLQQRLHEFKVQAAKEANSWSDEVKQSTQFLAGLKSFQSQLPELMAADDFKQVKAQAEALRDTCRHHQERCMEMKAKLESRLARLEVAAKNDEVKLQENTAAMYDLSEKNNGGNNSPVIPYSAHLAHILALPEKQKADWKNTYETYQAATTGSRFSAAAWWAWVRRDQSQEKEVDRQVRDAIKTTQATLTGENKQIAERKNEIHTMRGLLKDADTIVKDSEHLAHDLDALAKAAGEYSSATTTLHAKAQTLLTTLDGYIKANQSFLSQAANWFAHKFRGIDSTAREQRALQAAKLQEEIKHLGRQIDDVQRAKPQTQDEFKEAQAVVAKLSATLESKKKLVGEIKDLPAKKAEEPKSASPTSTAATPRGAPTPFSHSPTPPGKAGG